LLGLGEVRLVVPGPRCKAVRQRLAAQAAALEDGDALSWIEAVAEFDEPDAEGRDATW
jgi:hypothetical protein